MLTFLFITGPEMTVGMESLSIKDLLFDISKIVDGALSGNRDKVLAYVEQLGVRLSAAGENAGADRIQQMLSKKSAKTLTLAHLMPDRRLPVDGESRLPVADEQEIARDSVNVVLPADTRQAVDKFLNCFRSADQLAASGLDVSSSLLIYGPPGCGKTELARYIASELQLPLITSRVDALVSSYLGSTAKNLRSLFDHAASRPCILFLDEFDAIAKMRDDSRELGELKRVVISLLQNIDALGRNHVLIAATNHEHLLDRAVWRRFAWKAHLGLPDTTGRQLLLSRFFRGFLGEDELKTLVSVTAGLSGAQMRDASEGCVRDAVLSGRTTATLKEAIDWILSSQVSTASEPLTVGQKMLHLYSRDKKTFNQERLGTLFDKSQPQVSRLLQGAKCESKIVADQSGDGRRG